jgi:hypothetical protein
VAAGKLAVAEPSVTSTEATVTRATGEAATAVTWATGEPAAAVTWATGEPATAGPWATGEPAAGPERPTKDRRYW